MKFVAAAFKALAMYTLQLSRKRKGGQTLFRGACHHKCVSYDTGFVPNRKSRARFARYGASAAMPSGAQTPVGIDGHNICVLDF